MFFDFHLHSHYSHDSVLSPKMIIKLSLKKGLSGIAITDHNSIKGALITKKYSPDDFMVVIGSEIKTEQCEVIGLFLNEDIYSNDFFETIDCIRDQDGVSILPHPYKGTSVNPCSLVGHVDLVEGLNARLNPLLNEQARYLASKHQKSIVAGSDSHTFFEIGSVRNKLNMDMFDEESLRYILKKGAIKIEGSESSFPVRFVSRAIGRYKQSGIKGISRSLYKKINR